MNFNININSLLLVVVPFRLDIHDIFLKPRSRNIKEDHKFQVFKQIHSHKDVF